MTIEHCSPELLSRAIDGDLDGVERRRVDEHVGECAACRRTIDELLALGTRVRDAAEPIDAVRGRRALREILASRPTARRDVAVRVAAVAAVIVFVVAVLALVVRRPSTNVGTPESAGSELSRYDRGNRLEIYVARRGREVR